MVNATTESNITSVAIIDGDSDNLIWESYTPYDEETDAVGPTRYYPAATDTSNQYYWLVRKPDGLFYPYPLLYAMEEERIQSAKETNNPLVCEDWVAEIKEKIRKTFPDQLEFNDEGNEILFVNGGPSGSMLAIDGKAVAQNDFIVCWSDEEACAEDVLKFLYWKGLPVHPERPFTEL